jgi:hypothetical protein
MELKLGDRVALTYGVDEVGDLVGIAQYTFMNTLHYVRYTAADGRSAEGWFDESQLRFLSRKTEGEEIG